ncbi:helix-turn-helix domain-containing protein [Xanthomonas phaseoli]|uniref:helix-turn-helix domain-containing protein n=1 Tax=Xanthomonas phaseoli TaxID=1985254 RepID=UPI00193A54B6|nr:helix-turn-helix domain-containing protein [Xanthomonas phaseoli]UZB30945.1 helix-turn-helix domain-containing protein [Xanthomonas phaseoli pv. phaseoli]
MSAKVSGMVFERYPTGGGEMLLALALADHAHDDGTHIYPSIARLAAKTRQSERSVQYQLRRMEESGWLILVNDGLGGRAAGFKEGGKTRQYRISPEWMKGADIAPFTSGGCSTEKGADSAPFKGANSGAKGRKTASERVQKDAEKGAKLLHPNQEQPKATKSKNHTPHIAGADDSRGVCGTPAGSIAAALNRAALVLNRPGLRTTSQHPYLIAAAGEGVTAEHLLELSDVYPDKPAAYLITAARRQRASGANVITTGASAHAIPRECASERTLRLSLEAIERERGSSAGPDFIDADFYRLDAHV